MNAPVVISEATLPGLVRRAAAQLASATDAAEVLEARDAARMAYDAAKSAGRIARAKQAHDDVIGAVYRAQADALEIEAMAKRRLADEYDAAQERGEVASGRPKSLPDGETFTPTVTDLGLTHKDIHEARQIRDAEALDPGIVHRTITERLDAGHEPTKAALRGAISAAAMQGLRGTPRAPARPSPPDFRPDPNFQAMAALASAAQTIADKVAEVGVAFIAAGFLDEAMRRRNATTFRAGRDALNKILEACDAD